MKKIVSLCLFFFLLQNCGYMPIYEKNRKVNFYIETITFNNGDRDLSTYIKRNLNNYLIKNDSKKFNIDTKIKYSKDSISNNASGQTEEYQLSTRIIFIIKDEELELGTFEFTEAYTMNNFNDEFEEKRYEKTLKENMAQSITSKLLIRLSRINDN